MTNGWMNSRSIRHLSLASSSGSNTSTSSNRSRADSGSTISSSETINKSKTSLRRRSHRPRGCRGGSSRRKKWGGMVPKEIVGATVDLSTSEMGPPATKPVRAGDPMVLETAENILARGKNEQNRIMSDENAGRQRQPMHSSQGSGKYIPLTSNAAIQTNPNHRVCAMKTTEDKCSLLPTKGKQYASQILPPLHSKPVQPRPSELVTMQGPNVYSLQNVQSNANDYICHRDKNCKNKEFYMSHLHASRINHNLSGNFHQTQQQSFTSLSYEKQALPDFQLQHQAPKSQLAPQGTNKCSDEPDIYRNERIEKQRQMMSEGGSLFVTSPRSFLMGWKADQMTTYAH